MPTNTKEITFETNSVSTDERNEFLDNFFVMVYFYRKFMTENKKYFKRSVISLHMTLHALFVLFIDKFGVWYKWLNKNFIKPREDKYHQKNIEIAKKHRFASEEVEKTRSELIEDLEKLKDTNLSTSEKSNIREHIYNNEVLDLVNQWSWTENMTNLRKEVKKIKNGRCGVLLNLPNMNKVEKRNKAVKILNRTRNWFIHFRPKEHTHIFSSDFDLWKSCLEIIEHLLFWIKMDNQIIAPDNIASFYHFDVDIELIKKELKELSLLTRK